MNKPNNHLSFFDSKAVNRPLLDVLFANLTGSLIHNKIAALLFLFLCNFQRTLLHFSVTQRLFPTQDAFGQQFFLWIAWPIDYFITMYDEVSSSYYVLANLTNLTILVILILLIVIIVYSWKRNTSLKRFSRTIRIIGFIHQSFLFLIFHSILLKMANSSPKLMNFLATEVRRTLYISFVSLFALLNFGLALIFVWICYEPLHFTSDILAKRTKYCSLFSFLIKAAIILLLGVITDTQNGAIAASIIAFPMECVSFLVFILKVPYYELFPLKMENAFCYINLVLSLLNFIFAFVHSYIDFSQVVVLVFLSVPFSWRLSFNSLHRQFKRVMETHLKKIKDEDSFFLKFLVLENFIQKGSLKNNLLEQNLPNLQSFFLIEMIKEHNTNCRIQRCVCQHYYMPNPTFTSSNTDIRDLSLKPAPSEKYTVKEQNELFEELMYLFTKERLEQAALAFPKWDLVKLNLASLIVNRGHENRLKALLLLYHIEEHGKSYSLRAKATQIKNEIEEHIKTVDAEESQKSAGRLNIKLFIDSHSAYGKLEKLIESQANKHMSFWEELETQEPKMLRLLKISTEAENEYQTIQRFWKNQLANMDSYFLQIYLLYGIYLKMVKNVQEEADMILKRAIHMYNNIRIIESKHSNLHPVNMYNEENVVMRVSLQSDKFAHIISVSKNIENHLGYRRNVLIHKNIGVIMPEFIKVRHDDIVKKYVNTGKVKMMNKTRKVFAVHANGYLTSFHMYATPFPYVDSDYTMIAILKPVKVTEDIILTTTDGDIQGITKNIALSFGIRGDNLTQFNINSFCSKFKNLNRVFNFFAFVKYKSTEERIKVFEQSEQAYQDIISRKTNAFFKSFDEKIEKMAFSSMKYSKHRVFKGSSPQLKSAKTNRDNRNRNMSLFKKSPNRPPASPLKPPVATIEEKPEGTETDQIIEKAFGISSPTFRTVTEDSAADIPSNIKVPKTPKAKTPGGKIVNYGSSSSSNHDSVKSVQYSPPSAQSAPSEKISGFNLFGSDYENTFRSSGGYSRPSYFSKPSVLTSDYFRKGGHSTTRIMMLAQDFASQAKVALENEYAALYQNYVNGRQALKFSFYDHQQNHFKEQNYFVRIYNENVYDDILRVITLTTEESLQGRDSSNPVIGSYLSSEEEEEAVANIRAPPKGSKLSAFYRSREDGRQSNHGGISSPGLKKGSEKRVTFQKINSSFQTVDMVDEEEKNRIQDNPIIHGLYRRAYELISGFVTTSQGEIPHLQGKGVSKSLQIKVEKAINSERISRTLKFITRTVLVMFIITVLFLSWIAINTQSGISDSWEVVELLKSTYLRTTHILEINRRVQQLNLTELEYINIYTEDDIINEIYTFTDSVKDLNNAVRQQLASMGSGYREQMSSEKVDVKAQVYQLNSSDTEYLNPFELTDQIIEGAYMLVQLYKENKSLTELQAWCKFLQENIINGDIIYFQDMPQIEIKASTQVFTSTTVLNPYVLVFGIVLAIAVLLAIIRTEKNFLNRKRLTLSALLSISNHDIRQYKNAVSQVTKLMDPKSVLSTMITKKSQSSIYDMPTKKENKRVKHANYKGLYRTLIKIIAQVMIVLFSLTAMLAYLFSESSSISGMFADELEQLDMVYSNYFTTSLSLNALYQYTSGSSSMIRGRPADSEMESLLEDLKGTFNLFQMLSGSSGELASNVELFDTSNLCNNLFDNELQCQSLGGGVLMRGLTSVQIYLADEITDLKVEYDISNKTPDDLVRVFKFQGFIDADKIFSQYGMTAFEDLIDVMMANFKDHTDATKASLVRVIIVFVVVLLVVLFPIWKFAENTMIKARISIRRVLRMVSPAHINVSKTLKAALIRDSGLEAEFLGNDS